VPADKAAADLGGSTSGIAIAIAIAARDDWFEPSCVDVPSDATVTLVVRNAGRHPHNLTLADGAAVAVDAGQVAFLNTAISGDAVPFVCTIHPGMEGELRPVP
jgi:plastocyanin